MGRKRKTDDPRQMTLEFAWGEKIDKYFETRMEIQEAIDAGPGAQTVENEFEACIEIAAAIKSAIREWGGSRDQLVDAINDYFGRTKEGAKADEPTCRNPITINMLNNYLSKPRENPIPAYYLFAIHHITGSLEPARIIVAAEGAQVASGAEIRQMQMGKIEDLLAELQKQKRVLKGKRG